MRRELCLPVFFCLIVIIPSEALSQFSFDRIAATGEPGTVFVVGEPESITFESFSQTIINKDGDVIFAGSSESPIGTEDGIWIHRQRQSRINLHVKENRQAPYTSADTVFGSLNGEPTFGPLNLRDGIVVAYRAHLKGAGVTPNNDTALYREGWQLTREGSPSIGLGSDVGQVIYGDQFEFSGLTVETSRSPFPMLNRQSSNDTAIHMGGLLVEGANAIRGRLGDLRNTRPIVAPRSPNIVFRGTLTGEGGTELPNNQTIFFGPYQPYSVRPEIIARQGEGPQNSPNLRFDWLHHPVAGPDHVFFGVRLSGPNVNSSNDSAISQRGQLVVREGDLVSGAGPSVVLGDLGTDNLVGGGGFNFILNNQLVGSNISERNDWALISVYLDARGMLTTRAVAQEGDVVGGLPAGAMLAGLDQPHFQLSLTGDVIFNARFLGPQGGGDGLFYTRFDRSEPSLIVHTGQELDIGGGVFRTVSDIGLMEMSNPWDGRAAQINDRGEVVFGLTFSDGSQGIFTTVVPEPATIVLAALGGVSLFVVVWRRRSSRNVSKIR